MPIRPNPLSASPLLRMGPLRHRIQIVQPTLAQDTAGGWNVNSNNLIIECWAAIETITGVEKFAAHEFASNVTHSVWIRHPRSAISGSITAKMQVWWDSRQFQIESVLDPDGRKKILQLLCVEIADSSQQSTLSPQESTV